MIQHLDGQFEVEEESLAVQRIEHIRLELTRLGYACTGAAPFAVPDFHQVEAWERGHMTVYLAFTEDGAWDILAPICSDADMTATLEAMEQLNSEELERGI
jgi:hypothetical protein